MYVVSPCSRSTLLPSFDLFDKFKRLKRKNIQIYFKKGTYIANALTSFYGILYMHIGGLSIVAFYYLVNCDLGICFISYPYLMFLIIILQHILTQTHAHERCDAQSLIRLS